MDIMYIRKKQHGNHFYKETMDLVIVATKIEERAYYATQAMTAGFHVLCEKPVAMNMKELEEIIAISDKTGKKFTVHQPRRFDRDYLILKRSDRQSCDR